MRRNTITVGRKQSDMQDNTNPVRQALILIAQIVVMLLVLLATWWASEKHGHELLVYSAGGAAVIASVAVIAAGAYAIRQRRFPAWRTLGLGLVGVLIVSLLVMAYFGVIASVYDAYLFVTSSALSDTSIVVLVALITLLAGLLLFFIRLKWRCAYGLSEAAVGVIVASLKFRADALAATGEMPGAFTGLAILTAGVYLVVRGLDNIHQGLTKPPLDPLGQKVMSWLSVIGRKDAELGLSVSLKITVGDPASRTSGPREISADRSSAT
jgi:hypothetical protein